MESFTIHNKIYEAPSRMRILFSVTGPPFSGSKRGKWLKSRGYWIKENLSVVLDRGNVDITSNYIDGEFGLLLRIQEQAFQLAKKIYSNGHWESDWNPGGDYSKRPY